MNESEENQLRAALVASAAALGQMLAAMEGIEHEHYERGYTKNAKDAAARALKMLEGLRV